jgi:hypothetical protein
MATFTYTTARTVVSSRTFMSDTTKLGYELDAAIQWAYNKVYNSSNGPDMIMDFADEFTLTSRTIEQDLAASTGVNDTTLFGIKKLWLKLSGDIEFHPMIPVDGNDAEFGITALAASDTTTVATGHPVYYQLFNHQSVRFSPPLPSGAIVRADYFQFASLGTLAGISDNIHQCIIDKATSTVFNLLDDDRSMYWNAIAERNMVDALHALNRKVQAPVRIRPFRTRRRRL